MAYFEFDERCTLKIFSDLVAEKICVSAVLIRDVVSRPERNFTYFESMWLKSCRVRASLRNRSLITNFKFQSNAQLRPAHTLQISMMDIEVH